MTADRLSIPDALTIAEAALAVHRPGEEVLGVWADAEGVAVAHGYFPDVIATGEGPVLVSRHDGTVHFLGSIEQRDRLDAMREVALD